MLRLRTMVVAAAAAALLVVVACGGSGGGDAAPALERPDETGHALAQRFIELIRDKDVAGLSGFLADGFILQRATGSRIDKAQYLTNLPEIGAFTITSVSAHQEGNALVVSWHLRAEQTIDGVRYSNEPAPRLSTFVWQGGSWRMLSHANFNVPSR